MKKFLLFVFILLIAIALRMVNLDKLSGFYYDEASIYSIVTNFAVDMHRFLIFPIYYLIYKVWITLLGSSDIVIRSMSVFFGVCNVIVAYFLGLQIAENINKIELKNKIAFISMSLFAINSTLIYYSQEAKFYALTFLLLSFLLLEFLKLVKSYTNKNLILFFVSCFVLLYSQTTLSILVLLFILVAGFFIPKEQIKKFLIGNILIFLPLIILACVCKNYFSGNFEAVVYDNSFFTEVLENWFSPLLVGIQNNILNYTKLLFTQGLNLKFILYIFIPVIYFMMMFCLSFKYRECKILGILSLLFVSFHMLLSQFTYYNALVRYVNIVLPIVLLVCSVAIAQSLSKLSGKIFFTLILCLNLLILISPQSPMNLKRPTGYRALGEFLAENKISTTSDFILPIRVQLLDKYFFIKGNRYSFYDLKHKNAKEIQSYVDYNFQDKKYKNGKTLVLLVDRSICIFSDENLKEIKTRALAQIFPKQFVDLSNKNIQLQHALNLKLKKKQELRMGNWQIIVFD